MLKNELRSIYSRLDESQNRSQVDEMRFHENTSHDLGEMHSNVLKQRRLENCKLFSNIYAVRDPNVELRILRIYVGRTVLPTQEKKFKYFGESGLASI